ncbi:hypothetical protein Pfo_006811 [Paulownia fortunei]|nr:hypothetical protein Pfo_006811 [Paulownia fortunei]
MESIRCILCTNRYENSLVYIAIFLYHALLIHLRSKDQITLVTTASGVVVAIMPGGRTTHSHFKMPIDAIESSDTNDKMMAINNVNKLLKDVIGNDEDFGGKVVVFCENFRQILIVVFRATIYQTIFASLVKSYLWFKMKKITLSRNLSGGMI